MSVTSVDVFAVLRLDLSAISPLTDIVLTEQSSSFMMDSNNNNFDLLRVLTNQIVKEGRYTDSMPVVALNESRCPTRDYLEATTVCCGVNIPCSRCIFEVQFTSHRG